MKNRIVAIVLTVCTLLSTLSLSAFAKENDIVIEEEHVEEIVEEVISELIQAEEDAVVEVEISEVHKDYFSKPITVKDLLNCFKKIFFIKLVEAEDVSKEIVEDSTFTVTVTVDGRKTVYIGVDLEKHPEISNFFIFRKTVAKLAKKQVEYIDEDDIEFNLLSYQHIAGELALHSILHSLVELVGDFEKNSLLSELHERAKIADLNIDEDRVPKSVIDIFGFFLTDIFSLIFKFLFLIIT